MKLGGGKLWRICEVGWLKNHVTVKPFQMNVIFLTTLPTLKACNSPYMHCYFKRFFVLHSSEVIFSFLIKKSRQKAIEIETVFFTVVPAIYVYILEPFA